MGKTRIEIMTDNFPYEALTELLHVCYKEHLDAGRNYLAATQTVEDTKRRLEGRVCAVAYNEEGELVASIAGKRIKRDANSKKKWYEDADTLYIEQMAVRPDYRKTNLLVKLILHANKIDWVKKVDSWMTDTSAEADALVSAYLKMGFQIVDMVSWETTNYYSYVFRKPLNGKKYSDRYVKFRFFFHKLACQIKYTKEGKKRF